MVMAITTAKSRATCTLLRTSLIAMAMNMNIATMKNHVVHILPRSLLAMAMSIATVKNPTVHMLRMSMLAMIRSTVKNQSASFVALSMLAMTMSRSTSIIAVMKSNHCTPQIGTPATDIILSTLQLIQSRSTPYGLRVHRLVTTSSKANADAMMNTKREGLDITRGRKITFRL